MYVHRHGSRSRRRSRRHARLRYPTLPLAGQGRPFCHTEHVRSFRMLGPSPTFVDRQGHIGVYLAFESFEELVSAWLRSRLPIGCSAPGDLGCDSPVNVSRLRFLLSEPAELFSGDVRSQSVELVGAHVPRAPSRCLVLLFCGGRAQGLPVGPSLPL